jgi:hypothetical protein
MADYSQLLARTNELFRYENGKLFRIVDCGNTSLGEEAGWTTAYKYKAVCIDYKCYLIHKLIYLMHYGVWPKIIDHINGNRSDNRIENLRVASISENAFNQKITKRNTSGCKNVSWDINKCKWVVRLTKSKKVKQWYIEDYELAELLAHEARELYHGDFANHG